MPARPYRDNPFEPSSASRVDPGDYYGNVSVSVLSSFKTVGFRAEMYFYPLAGLSGSAIQD